MVVVLIMYIEQEEARRRIFIPSFVLGVDVVIVIVLMKHRERETIMSDDSDVQNSKNQEVAQLCGHTALGWLDLTRATCVCGLV